MADDITTQILIEIRDEIRGTNGRLDDFKDDVNRRFSILTALLRGLDTRVGKMEESVTFLPRRVDVLEQKVATIEDELDQE